MTLLASLLQFAAILIAAPLLSGIIARTKAVLAGRRGAPLLQPYYDLGKLMRKGMVVSTTTTAIFLAGPVVVLATALVACLLLPAGSPPALSFTGDMIVFVYLFALARFFLTAAALDTGSPFEGMGAAREATFAALAEPALLFGFLALARLSGSLRLASMLDVASFGWKRAAATIVLVILSWFIVMLAENSRVPVDDPTTHLELTMIHEVMILDHSGPALAMNLYAAALKLFIFGVLVVRLAVPLRSGYLLLDSAAVLGGVALLGVAVGFVESSMARLRLARVPQLLVTATLLSVFAVVLLVR